MSLLKKRLIKVTFALLVPLIIIVVIISITFYGTGAFLNGLIDSFSPFNASASECTKLSGNAATKCIENAKQNYDEEQEKLNGNNSGSDIPQTNDKTSLKINEKSKHYISENAYNNNGLWGQCTWFVNGRASEKTGKKLPANLGHGGQYYAGAKARGYKTGKKVKSNSIVSMSGGAYGHVAFIEKVENGKVYITESNIKGLGVITYSTVSLKSIEKGYYLGMSINGYVYLD